jgi:hypothetical protein
MMLVKEGVHELRAKGVMGYKAGITSTRGRYL